MQPVSCTRWSGILSPSESSEHFTCGSELVLTKGSRHCRRDWGEYTECSPTPYLLYIIYRLHAVFYIYSAACTVWESTPCWLSSSTATYISTCLYTSYLRMYIYMLERKDMLYRNSKASIPGSHFFVSSSKHCCMNLSRSGSSCHC